MVTSQACQALQSCPQSVQGNPTWSPAVTSEGCKSPESYLTDDLSGYLRFAVHIKKPTLSSIKLLGYHQQVLHYFCTASVVGNHSNMQICSSKSLHLEALLMSSQRIPYLLLLFLHLIHLLLV